MQFCDEEGKFATFDFNFALTTINGQNIDASTKIFWKQMFDFDALDSIKWKYRSFGSFKNHAYTSNAIDGWEVVHQN